jgi:hypothetical protein
MKAYVVTEGPLDVALLGRLLPEDLQQDVLLVQGGGLSSAKSLARSLLVSRRTPVVLVMDADSVVPEVIEERRQSAEEIIGGVAAHVPNKVVVAIPTLEAVFFRDPAILERLLGRPVSEDVRLVARYDPKGGLERLLGTTCTLQKREELLAALTPEDLAVLQQSEPIKELMDFLTEARKWASDRRAVPVEA